MRTALNIGTGKTGRGTVGIQWIAFIVPAIICLLIGIGAGARWYLHQLTAAAKPITISQLREFAGKDQVVSFPAYTSEGTVVSSSGKRYAFVSLYVKGWRRGRSNRHDDHIWTPSQLVLRDADSLVQLSCNQIDERFLAISASGDGGPQTPPPSMPARWMSKIKASDAQYFRVRNLPAESPVVVIGKITADGANYQLQPISQFWCYPPIVSAWSLQSVLTAEQGDLKDAYFWMSLCFVPLAIGMLFGLYKSIKSRSSMAEESRTVPEAQKQQSTDQKRW